MTMRRKVVFGLGLLVLGLALGAGALIGPRNVVGMLRYDTRREGALKVGDPAPAVDLVALDGTSRVGLTGQLHGRPLVLIFGSFT